MDEAHEGSARQNPDFSAEALKSDDYRRMLIAKAINPGRRVEQRVRLLDLVQLLGGPLGPTELFDLQTLLRHRSAAV